MQQCGVNISTTLLGHHQCHPKSFIHMYLQNKFDVSRLGAVEVHVYVTNQALACDLEAPSFTLLSSNPHRKEWQKTPKQKRDKKKQIKKQHPSQHLGSLSHCLPTLSLKRPQKAVRDYPTGSLWVVAVPSHLFTFFPSSFSAESLLPWGLVRPVPALRKLDNAETTKMKSLEENVNNFSQPGPPIFQ